VTTKPTQDSGWDTPIDERQSEWYRFLQEIEQLLPDAQWAAETLEGIQETVERTRTVSEGQRRAVRNIEAAKDRTPRGSRRRYEGWRR